ncbi:MAG: Hpt domain-containing protein [Spirochaetaceae bacterium]|jgi:HPt (histidine-containing phosphotransfer) domain-containing protein|nr:Hpt domain-containing protein [Spirochaetaceae bacterium]
MQENVVYVDQAEGLKRVMQNAKLYVKLLNKFKVDFKTKPAELLTAVKAEQYESAQGVAHTIKGTAANLGMAELYKQSLAVEGQIKDGTVSPESAQVLQTCFDHTVSAIDAVLKQYE